MPTYEYNCKACGKKFEMMIPSAEKTKVRCPLCHSSDLQEIYGFNTIKSSSRAASCADCPTGSEKGCPLAT